MLTISLPHTRQPPIDKPVQDPRHLFRCLIHAILHPIFDDMNTSAYHEHIDVFIGFLIHPAIGDPVFEDEFVGDDHAFFEKVHIAVLAEKGLADVVLVGDVFE